MKIKYFRFLFCGNKGCMVHFGELKDTLTGERFTFLYLYGAENAGDGRDSGKGLFLCPDCVDLVVAGNANDRTDAVLSGILGGTQVGELILPESDYTWSAELRKAKRCRYLGSGREDEVCAEILAAGWNFFVRRSGDGTLSMAHMPECGEPSGGRGCPGQLRGEEPMGERLPENGGMDEKRRELPPSEAGLRFDDCVMSVKVLDGSMRCLKDPNPDGYGCALGCALKRDYDVCKYQREGVADPCLAGTLLCGGPLTSDGWAEWKETLGSRMDTVRFFALPGLEDRSLLESLSDPFKRYYIGLQGDMDAELTAAVPESGLCQIPVLLGDGDGICCSGLLRYAQSE